ncbi:uncharacterized protein FIBRA_01948 [Fibroporia radiculosa]|uniref:C3H1-type domain-containing protein n=1 Tax=Fibroporia radiculosa TaxID=599839 RepID=J4G197_9APHY|nr:uncharacterized protein FIBRA_01948 [Fibroporia radiculosa]CCL99923.1 predicted protein [Fibroporia radiculosa]
MQSAAKLCRNFALGHCPQGDQCKYLHPLVPSFLPAYAAPRPAAASHAQGQLNPYSRVQAGPGGEWLPSTFHAQQSEMPQLNWPNPTPSTSAAGTTPHVSFPQFKPLSWRTTLCRHFTKNRGWCPLGDECNYIHDLELAEIALEDARFPPRRGLTGPPGGRDGQSKAGTKHSHCWAYVQGMCHVKDCPYLHPVAVHRFVRHTPCLQWPNCPKGVLCPYKHPEPIIPKVPVLPPSIESPHRARQPSPADNTLSGAVQYYGTTYFPLQPQTNVSPSAPPAPRPHLPAPPAHMHPHPHPPPAPLQLPPPPPMRPYDAPSLEYTHSFGSQSFGSPPWMGPRTPISPPTQMTGVYAYDPHAPYPHPHPHALTTPDYRMPVPMPSPAWKGHIIYEADVRPLSFPAPPSMSAVPQGALQLQGPSGSGPPQRVVHPPAEGSVATGVAVPAGPSATGEDEFPYVPPKMQRVGHARRISVALRSKEDSDALGLFKGDAVRRESWQTHGTRHAHKSWAPSSSGIPFL